MEAFSILLKFILWNCTSKWVYNCWQKNMRRQCWGFRVDVDLKSYFGDCQKPQRHLTTFISISPTTTRFQFSNRLFIASVLLGFAYRWPLLRLRDLKVKLHWWKARSVSRDSLWLGSCSERKKIQIKCFNAKLEFEMSLRSRGGTEWRLIFEFHVSCTRQNVFVNIWRIFFSAHVSGCTTCWALLFLLSHDGSAFLPWNIPSI